MPEVAINEIATRSGRSLQSCENAWRCRGESWDQVRQADTNWIEDDKEVNVDGSLKTNLAHLENAFVVAELSLT